MFEPIVYGILQALACVTVAVGGKAAANKADLPDVLLTGAFHSSNWIRAHLAPMRMSGMFGRIVVVTTSDITYPEGIEIVRPPAWLARVVGLTAGRLLTFIGCCIVRRPYFIGGFHLLFNGLTAIVLARLLRLRSLYFCVGGPAEVLDGGLLSENSLLGRLQAPSPRIEQVLTRFVGLADLVICMGSRASAFMRERAQANTAVIPGGVGLERERAASEKRFDLIFLGRLAPIKNLHALLQAVALLKREQPVTLAIVGSGQLGAELHAEALRLGIDREVLFAGLQSNTEEWLAASRVFVLPSISEGLSLSLMEAMACSLPAVVSNVGDLADLVKDGDNGILLSEATARGIADAVKLCLLPSNYNRLRDNARRAAESVSLAAAAKKWKDVIMACKACAQYQREQS